MSREVVFMVRRYDPDTDEAPHWKEYLLTLTPGMTVLDGLWQIKEGRDARLAWRASCRMGICGSCGMWIEGMPRLACNTQVTDLGPGPIRVAPLPNFDILKDLVPDLAPMFDAHAALAPWVIRGDESGEQEEPTREYHQSMEAMEEYLQFSYCIKCGCCAAACPTCATDPVYSGPMPLAQAHRYNTDTRDDGFAERASLLDGEKGPWRCHFAGECSRVCPKGVDPAKAIQILKRNLVLDVFGLRKGHRPASLAEVPAGTTRRHEIPEAPPQTIGD